MSSPRHTLTPLLHRLGAGRRARVRAFNGASASALILTTLALVASLTLIPATASAYATLEGPPKFSAAPGLPDGRIYEQVSPANKSGNEAGASATAVETGTLNHYGLASADGNSVLFEGTGPIGESPWAASEYFVATRSKQCPYSAWCTRALLPRDEQAVDEIGGLLFAKSLNYLAPSADLTHALAVPTSGTLSPQASASCLNQLYLAGPEPFTAATWLERPEAQGAVENCAKRGSAPAGGSPDFSTVYFTYAGTLLPEDEPRATHAGGGSGENIGAAWGFYEEHEGELREAGILPADSPYPGKPSPYGAVPAASWHGRSLAGNQVSTDGTRAFFVSPDPASCTYHGGHNDCALDPPELYLRENGTKTVLISQDTQLPDAGGLPAGAPTGVLGMPNSTENNEVGFSGAQSFVFASPDGSQAFFQSDDALTAAAEQASPGSAPKTYDFDVDTGLLTYMPGVVGQIVATDTNGSSLAFVRPEAGGSPAEFDLWSAGSPGGTVAPVTELPEYPSVPEARLSSDGSVLVFQTAATIAGFNNRGGHSHNASPNLIPGSEEIYRYDVPANSLGCVSCAPVGVTPRGNASFSIAYTAEDIGELGEPPVAVDDDRGISSGGDRIFFESPDPLVPQDTNTDSPRVTCVNNSTCAQGDDVYEWENGVVYLISTGKSPRDSYLLDNSASGDDVFFATTQGLVPGDTDGGFDVYDARIPHEGDNPPAAAVPCEGPVCQGPPNVPAPLMPSGSATFTGLGNPPEETTPGGQESNKKKATTKAVKCKKNQVKKKGKCVKKAKAKKASHNGRTKS